MVEVEWFLKSGVGKRRHYLRCNLKSKYIIKLEGK